MASEILSWTERMSDNKMLFKFENIHIRIFFPASRANCTTKSKCSAMKRGENDTPPQKHTKRTTKMTSAYTLFSLGRRKVGAMALRHILALSVATFAVVFAFLIIQPQILARPIHRMIYNGKLKSIRHQRLMSHLSSVL